MYVRKYLSLFGMMSLFLTSQASSQDSSSECRVTWGRESVGEGFPLPPPTYPFSLSGSSLWVGSALVKTPGLANSHLDFCQWEMALCYTHPICWSPNVPDSTQLDHYRPPNSGLIFGGGWVATRVDLENNPAFNETFFHYLALSCGAYTHLLPNWQWTLLLSSYLDMAELSLFDYALYQGSLRGQYQPCDWLELNCGMLIEVGLKQNKIWPIIGFIYQISEKWHLHAVYPMNVALSYDLSECFKAEMALRFVRNRHRVKADSPEPQALFAYRALGAEARLSYRPSPTPLALALFLGSTFNGDLKISNQNNKQATHFKFSGSFYSGVSGALSF